MNNDFYVYGHFMRNKCFYIGKGRKQRAWTFCQRSKKWNELFAKNKPIVKIFEKDMSESEAYEREAFYVSEYLDMGHPLVNIAKGGYLNAWDDRASKLLSEMRSGENHYNFGGTVSKDQIDRMIKTKKERNSFGRYWLGKKRDPELLAKMLKASQTPEALKKNADKRRGRKHSEEHRRKIGEASRNAPRTKEWNEAIGRANKGRPSSHKGKKLPKEHRQKISEARKNSQKVKDSGIKIWEIRRKNGTDRNYTTSKARVVVCIETGKKYRCAKEAAKLNNLSDKHIQACCVGRRKTHGGYTWRYEQPRVNKSVTEQVWV